MGVIRRAQRETTQGEGTLRTFLIADIRGYTAFTREHGDETAARLATKFADLARDAVEARSGAVIELRGDEALAVFTSSGQAIRAAVELQAACEDETAADASLPLPVGVGIDAGEAVPVEGGFRGVALNMAARLCSKAAAGEVLVTRAAAELAGEISGLRFEERGAADLKGFEQPIELLQAMWPDGQRLAVSGPLPEAETEAALEPLPPELDPITPMVDREHEMHWLRGTWRQARRGKGRLVFVSGPAGIGKTRLLADLASWIHQRSGRVRYAGAGGAGAALAIAAVREAEEATAPTLLVVNDVEALGPAVIAALDVAAASIADRPAMIVGAFRDAQGLPALASFVESVDDRGDGHRSLAPLDVGGVADIVRLYAGREVQDAPVESMWRASGGVPGRVHEVVSEWARDEAKRRLAAAAGWLAAGRSNQAGELEFANNVIALRLGRLYDVDAPGAAVASEMCPYKGLASFEVEDAAYFFGRERLVGELAARTVGVGLLGVVGPSGSGKSSAVLAGLIPSLTAGLLPGSERWHHAAMRPGEHPIQELRSALGSVGFTPNAEDDVAAALDQSGSDGRLVLVVDQFEELFTTTIDADERNSFVDALIRAAGEHERVIVVLTIRADFYGHCAEYLDLARLLAANHVLVGTMSADELRRAVELPARRVGLRVESALSHALVAEVTDEPGGLPLLSTTLVELWREREGGWLRMERYKRTGGVRGAVARLAEASYQQLTDVQQQQVARTILLRLVGSGEGETAVRRRVPITEFEPDRNIAAAAVLDRLTQDRLLTRSDGHVEIAHEALIREWPRLRDWLEEDVQGRQVRAHVTQAARQWQEAGQNPGELYRGPRLSASLDWWGSHAGELNELEREFLSESRQATERDAQRQRRTNRRLRGLLVGVASFLVLALVAGGLALVQRGRARDEADRARLKTELATARELTEASLANLGVDPDRSILLAIQAVKTYRGISSTVPRDAVEALHTAVQNSRLVVTLSDPATGNVAFSPNGKLLATSGFARASAGIVASQGGRAVIWNAATGRKVLSLSEQKNEVGNLEFSPDGSELITKSSLTDHAYEVDFWDVRTGAKVRSLRLPGPLVASYSSPDGTRLATTGFDGSLTIWDLRTGKMVRKIVNPDSPLCGVAWSPDGARVAAAACFAGSTANVWDLATGKQVLAVGGHGSVIDVGYSPDGTRLVTGGIEGIGRVWDARTGRLVATLVGHTGWIYDLRFSPDGRAVATGSSDGTARVWDAATGRQLYALSGHTQRVKDLAFTPDGARLATGSDDGTARIWDVSPGGSRDAVTLAVGPGRVLTVAYSPDGRRLVTGGDGHVVRLWNASTGRVIARLKLGPRADTSDIHFSPDGTRILFSGDGTPYVTDSSLSRVLLRLRVKTIWNFFPGGAWSPDGRLIALGDADGRATLSDANTGKLLRTFVHSKDSQSGASVVYRVAFSPDGKELATVNWNGTVKVWDVATGRPLLTISGHTQQVNAIQFSPDGRGLLTAASDGTAKIWALPSGRHLVTMAGQAGAIWDAEFSPDGKLVATAGDDTTARLWNAETGKEILKLTGHTFALYEVDFSPDGSRLATASGDGTARVSLLRLDDLVRLAKSRVTRHLTDAECRQYLHQEQCPRGI